MSNPNIGTPTVCLDAGHYGAYNQSPVVPEFREGEVNWRLQTHLQAALEERGIRVITTRSDPNKDLGLTQRGKMAQNCDLFISLHVNAADNPDARYVLGVYMMDDKYSKYATEYLLPAVASIMKAPMQQWTKVSSTDRDGDGVKDEYYGVLRGAKSVGVPGLILEHGFYTNEAQARWLMDDENLIKLAQAEADAIAQWFMSLTVGYSYVLNLKSVRRDSRGPRVAMIQSLLTDHGFACDVDGRFGSITELRVMEFQNSRGLIPDGRVGALTMLTLLGYEVPHD